MINSLIHLKYLDIVSTVQTGKYESFLIVLLLRRTEIADNGVSDKIFFSRGKKLQL